MIITVSVYTIVHRNTSELLSGRMRIQYMCKCTLGLCEPGPDTWLLGSMRRASHTSSQLSICSAQELSSLEGSSVFPFYSSKRVNRGRFLVRRRIRRILSASGGLLSARGCGVLRIRRPVYIPYATRGSLCRLGLGLPVSAVRPRFVFLCGCSSGGRRWRYDEDASKVRSCAGSSDISAGFPVFA
jgi:hypothetical protein